MLEANGNEASFISVIKDSPIYCLKDAEELKQALRYAMLVVGLKAENFPEGSEKNILIAHVLRNYGNHTPSEIKLAFDMAITGQIECDPNCYQNFSCLYFSSIMSAYRKWAGQVHRYEESRKKEIKELPAPPVPDQNIIDDAYSVWLDLKRFDLIPLSSYEALERLGLISYTKEEKKHFMKEAKKYMISIGLEGDRYTIMNAKKIAVQYYFMKRLSEGQLIV